MRKISVSYLLAAILSHNVWLSKYLNDETYLKIIYKGYMAKKLDLVSPKTYTEKLQWLKLHNRKQYYSSMVDKYEAKKWVSDIIGEEYIIPTLGVWDSFDEIDFSSLPSSFVLKCTHDSGGLVICKDKTKFDIKKARKKINKSLKHNFYYNFREWPYKNVKPRIIAETYIEEFDSSGLKDYKFFTFNGKVKCLFIASDRQKENEDTKFDFFDANFLPLNIVNGHPNSSVKPKKPSCFDEMKQLSERLSEGIPHLRCDFYEIDGRVYFGELTFYHWSGLVPFEPEVWDKKMGEWLNIES